MRRTFETEDPEGEGKKLAAENIIDITYFTDGMTHKLRLVMDQNWQLKNDPSDPLRLTKPISTLLHKFKNVISLNNNPKLFTRQEFINIFQCLPLINYLFSYETIEMFPALPHVEETEIKFIIAVDNEQVWMGEPSDVEKCENPYTFNIQNSSRKGNNAVSVK